MAVLLHLPDQHLTVWVVLYYQREGPRLLPLEARVLAAHWPISQVTGAFQLGESARKNKHTHLQRLLK